MCFREACSARDRCWCGSFVPPPSTHDSQNRRCEEITTLLNDPQLSIRGGKKWKSEVCRMI